MNNITVCTAVWKRPEIFKIWLDCWLSLDPKPNIVVVGSADDHCEDIALRSECIYYRMPNQPVGAKWNLAHQEALKCDYLLTTASDDVMDQAMWEYFCTFKGERLTLRDLYFYDTQTKTFIYWPGYQQKSAYFGFPIGAHQLTRFDVMEKIHFQPFNPLAMAHEHDTERKMKVLGIKSLVIPMELTGGIGIDIKSKGSHSPFKVYPGSQILSIKEMERRSPELIEKIMK